MNIMGDRKATYAYRVQLPDHLIPRSEEIYAYC